MTNFYNQEQFNYFLKHPVVWTNGCFDILHVGHIRMINFCAEQAQKIKRKLIIGIDSDDKVKKAKGLNRPYNNELIRQEMLYALKGVDFVTIFKTEQELEDLVKLFKPELMVVGDEYKDKKVVGGQHAKKIHFFEKIKGYSTTNILKNI